MTSPRKQRQVIDARPPQHKKHLHPSRLLGHCLRGHNYAPSPSKQPPRWSGTLIHSFEEDVSGAARRVIRAAVSSTRVQSVSRESRDVHMSHISPLPSCTPAASTWAQVFCTHRNEALSPRQGHPGTPSRPTGASTHVAIACMKSDYTGDHPDTSWRTLVEH